jgi:hypothetical protein
MQWGATLLRLAKKLDIKFALLEGRVKVSQS